MTVDELFDRYKRDFKSGADPDPVPYVARLEGAERRELEALIEGFLATMPARAHDPERLAATPAGALARRVVATLMEEPATDETWVTLLPRARQQAQILRSDLVRRLARQLGAADKEHKVAAYYHRMEQGRLPAAGVSERVLTALSGIVGVPLERLRAAGERLAPPPSAPGVFARTAAPSPASAPAAEEAPAEPAHEDRDEVDELFAGR